ncbi:MAG: bifunctional diaminohydroxyphosphoribosylaminopyrimidine deaminase/5-amino-6-(5-phosphoribosylamino)uracil reductase RibD [Bacteroidales bacterium]|nr:bifunctional diaminohydroxyphosphoribosylaminopyrimidine deaminase/5-amino-6-(5-phosphoribosylamino)uracil reductase RibD [Bacteroidales bacterium]
MATYTDDEIFMRRCLELAANGLGSVQPNPMVGAVITVDGRIIGEGWHQKYGEAHAEINALRSVKQPELLSQATLYVNLEPCSHFGKTPPCCDALIRHHIPRVVIGTVDSNPKVSGEGIRRMREAGIDITTGVLADDCRRLNKRFFTFHEQHRPYIILKWAQTLDGFMDIDRRNGDAHNYWITNQELKVMSHRWRSEEDAILIGYNTLQNDHPQLTTREYTGKNPQRFVMARKGTALPDGFNLLADNVQEALQQLYEKDIQSVIVEGGRKTLDKFIQSGLWDEARILTGNKTFGTGLPAPVLQKETKEEIEVNGDVLRRVES